MKCRPCFSRFSSRDDVGAQRDRMRQCRHAEAGRELVGHRRAAHLVATLEHQGLAPGAGQIGRGNQAVVAAADDDRTAHLIFPFSTARARRCGQARP